MTPAHRARLQNQLNEIDTAISKINKAGQTAAFSGQAGSQSVTQGDLKTLMAERQRLEKQLFGGIRSYSAIGA